MRPPLSWEKAKGLAISFPPPPLSLISILPLLAVLHAGRQLINAAKLPGPFYVVEELAVVEAVVVRGVALRVVGRRQRRLLVPIQRVVEEELLDLLGDFHGREPAVRPGTPLTA